MPQNKEMPEQKQSIDAPPCRLCGRHRGVAILTLEDASVPEDVAASDPPVSGRWRVCVLQSYYGPLKSVWKELQNHFWDSGTPVNHAEAQYLQMEKKTSQ